MKRLDNATFLDKNWIEIFRQPVATYCRVMWYLRSRLVPTQSIRWWDEVTEKNKDTIIFKPWFNVGKRSEFASRVRFQEWHTCKREQDLIEANKRFIAQYT